MYLPDAIASYQVAGKTYLVTANEGDAREWGSSWRTSRLSTLALDPPSSSNAAAIQASTAAGRLNVTTMLGNIDADPARAHLHVRRPLLLDWNAEGAVVGDSGNQIELITAKRYPQYFNSNHAASNFDNRSDDKGPEPEAVTIATVGNTPFAFIGLERIGGVMVWDLTLPEAPRFVSYVNTRDFAFSAQDGEDNAAALSAAGDVGPEASVFVAAEDSPTGEALLVLGNEVSGTTAILSVTPIFGGN